MAAARRSPSPHHQGPYVDESMVAFAQSGAAFAQSPPDQSWSLQNRFNIHRQADARRWLDRTRGIINKERDCQPRDQSATGNITLKLQMILLPVVSYTHYTITQIHLSKHQTQTPEISFFYSPYSSSSRLHYPQCNTATVSIAMSVRIC